MLGRSLSLTAALALSLVARASLADGGRSSGAAPAARLALSTCQVLGVPGESRCGTYEVAEDRAHSEGRKISLRIVVLPATGAGPALAPVVELAGGPGQSAVEEAAGLAYAHPKVRERHDIVLVDLRGTGGSAPLTCAELSGVRGVQGYLDDFLPAAAVRSCHATHAGRDLSQYRTDVAVDDVADVLTALGYPKAHLWGGSYGTRAALELARRHPDRVATLGLAGLVPPEAHMPVTFARDAQDALDATFRKCAADAACHRAFPRVEQELAAVLQRAEREPFRAVLTDPQTGAQSELRLNARGVAQTIRYMLYLPRTAVLIPLYVHQAATGDIQPLADTAADFAGFAGGILNGFFLSVTCAENVQFITEDEVAAATRRTFLDDFRVRAQQAACAAWPVPAAPAAELQPVHSDAPALLFSGERDPVTPARWGEQVARTMPNALHLVVPDGGHDYGGLQGADCVNVLLEELIERGTTHGLDTSCIRSIKGPTFPTEPVASEVTLTEAQRDRLVGTYLGKDGLSLTVDVVEGRLRTAMSGETDKILLVPHSATSFGFQGLPPPYALEVEESGGLVVGLRIIGMSDQPLVLKKQ